MKPLAILILFSLFQAFPRVGSAQTFNWKQSPPENEGLSSEKLQSLGNELAARNTTGFLVIRNDSIVYEWYAQGHSRSRRHYTASMAKALVGGVSTALAISDQRMGPDDLVSQYVPQWKRDPLKSQITLRQLGSHTSGLQDAKVRDETGLGKTQNDFPGPDEE